MGFVSLVDGSALSEVDDEVMFGDSPGGDWTWDHLDVVISRTVTGYLALEGMESGTEVSADRTRAAAVEFLDDLVADAGGGESGMGLAVTGWLSRFDRLRELGFEFVPTPPVGPAIAEGIRMVGELSAVGDGSGVLSDDEAEDVQVATEITVSLISAEAYSLSGYLLAHVEEWERLVLPNLALVTDTSVPEILDVWGGVSRHDRFCLTNGVTIPMILQSLHEGAGGTGPEDMPALVQAVGAAAVHETAQLFRDLTGGCR